MPPLNKRNPSILSDMVCGKDGTRSVNHLFSSSMCCLSSGYIQSKLHWRNQAGQNAATSSPSFSSLFICMFVFGYHMCMRFPSCFANKCNPISHARALLPCIYSVGIMMCVGVSAKGDRVSFCVRSVLRISHSGSWLVIFRPIYPPLIADGAVNPSSASPSTMLLPIPLMS